MRFAAALALLCAACARPRASTPARDAAVEVAVAATHVCYGAGGSAVELPRGTACASVGASDTAPVTVPTPPPPRRTRGPSDAAALF